MSRCLRTCSIYRRWLLASCSRSKHRPAFVIARDPISPSLESM